jgi:hypothetical protein
MSYKQAVRPNNLCCLDEDLRGIKTLDICMPAGGRLPCNRAIAKNRATKRMCSLTMPDERLNANYTNEPSVRVLAGENARKCTLHQVIENPSYKLHCAVKEVEMDTSDTNIELKVPIAAIEVGDAEAHAF